MIARLNDVEQYYDDLGAGVPLLCLPAFPFDGRMYREQRALAEVARVIVPDYRGTGRSGATTGTSTMERLADDMFALLDVLGVERAVVLGVSMGDYVAFAMYRRDPSRFRGFIIADTRVEADSPATTERRRQTVEGLRRDGTGMLRDRVNDLFSAEARRDNPTLVAEQQAQALAANAEGLALITLGMAERADSTDVLPRITVPTMLICGEGDTVSPPDGMRAMAAQIPGHPPLHIIPGAGHLSPLEQPAAFNALVREFLAGLA